MNMELFRLINNLANKNIVLDKIMMFFSKDVPYIFMAVTAIVFILGITKKNEDYRKIAFSTFIFTALNLILSYIIGGIYYVDRPFVNNKVNLLSTHVADASLPSDHATGTMSIALGLRKYRKLLGRILMVLSIIVGFSRIYVGHHYPLDIITAYTIVIITNYLYNSMLRIKIYKIYDKAEKIIMKKLELMKLI
ncbi:undecaprenyl-diphosphatase [Clostridium gasigenes]|uniref:Undecaprenyl-diphosphatase n=1 Tax=Clostridium gasigenes TaxID=94869 RepID=A0A1H0QMF3_9CLOT|nr:undecaprenyl-diphosphatase [Clostridium gasigenes]MBU3108044.1 undecaprenyl-diphosphatase [Clostridium gasigenes]SDP17906.1 undecaprenyl-diphosphatase [Clostridium gasigenes]